MESLKNLKTKRGQLKAQLTRYKNFLDTIDNDNIDYLDLETRFARIKDILDRFDDAQGQIEILISNTDNPDIKDEELERIDFENSYFNVNKRTRAYLNKRVASPSEADNTSDFIESNIKLPTLNLPNFTGQFDEWIGFRDLFMDIVDKNDNISKVQKFYYLKVCLKGEAADVIKGIPINNENYDIAWTMLHEQYENIKRIIYKHMRAIYDLPIVKPDSEQSLKTFIHNFNKNFRALTTLGQPTDKWDTPMICTIRSKIDCQSKKDWDKFIKKDDLTEITVTRFMDFLSERADLMESEHDDIKQKKEHVKVNKTFIHLNSNVTCSFCSQSHFNSECKIFISKPVTERFNEVKKFKLCTNCLRPGHFVNECRSRGCKTCGRKHNSLLHGREFTQNNINKIEPEIIVRQDVATTPSISTCATLPEQSQVYATQTQTVRTKRATVLLATALVYIFDDHGNKVECRALLDTGSHSNFMTSALSKRLGIKTINTNIPVAGVNGLSSSVSKQTRVRIMSLDGHYSTHDTFLIIDKITDDLPQVSFDMNAIELPTYVTLADPYANESRPVNILLGAHIFFDILGPGQVKRNRNSPILHETKLGWLIVGPMYYLHDSTSIKCNLVTNNFDELNENVKKFWQLEELPKKRLYTREELECEEHFVQTFKRDSEGRFELTLPLKENYNQLGKSETNAIKQFYNLEKRLNRNEILKRDYINFMNEYESLEHMKQVSNANSEIMYYLPHHGVLKEDSTTTKLRVVFNASAVTDTGLSLNNVLMVGPVIQNDLFTIALNFRTHNVVFTADVEKMYRQINIISENRDLQRIVWRSDPTYELKHYQLKTVTYGTAAASFMACRCLHQLAAEYEDFSEASYAIKNDFYMDDLISGSVNVEKAFELKTQISRILDSGGFRLRKWTSNCPELFDSNTSSEVPSYFISKDENIKTLGLIWNPNLDSFSYLVNAPDFDCATKRFVLSTISKIFDPLGLINPVIVQGKLILQKLWQKELGWDECLTSDLLKLFREFYADLTIINDISIPRQVILPHVLTGDIQIHGFSDASEAAFGACLYVRSYDCEGNLSVRLLCAKSKVAPLKKITLPRLELNAAVLLSQLIAKVLENFRITPTKIYLWSDSTIVLHWLSSEPNTWNTYVANLVSEIQNLTEQFEWRHVSSQDNPADLVSRGCSSTYLKDSALWWSGPKFLRLDPVLWPVDRIKKIIDIPDMRTKIISLITNNGDFLFSRFSTLTKLQNVFAYVLRFINRLKTKTAPSNIMLSRQEMDNSLAGLIKLSQFKYFENDIKRLKLGKDILVNSRLSNLNVFLDERELLRVGGRIRHSHQPFDKKYPLILDPKHILTHLIIEYEHKLLLHAGQQAVLASLRRKYWPIHGKSAVRNVLHKCITCFKCRPSNKFQLMGDLPKSRLVPARPFSRIGLDYAGPIMLKDGTTRTRKLVKGYLCIFICFLTKAVHIELAGDLTSKTFLNCLKRFVSRRGLCNSIYSDNGTNFVGANNDIQSVIQSLAKNSELNTYLAVNQIKWTFNCPYTPHQGGLWEAAVKSAKYHLVRIIGDTHLTYEHLNTVLCQIEAVLNSRPLTPLSNDPEDLVPLTPAHFLIGDVLTAIPQINSDQPDNRLKMYERLQKMVQHFWRRWSLEYVTGLQRRSKWNKINPNLSEGDLVIVMYDDSYPLQWKTDRVVDVHPGRDNVVRVVSVKTSSGVIKRGVSKLCKLPIDTAIDSIT